MEDGAIFILSSGLRTNGLGNVGKLLVGLNIIYCSSSFTKSENRTISFSALVPIGVALKPIGPERGERLTLSCTITAFHVSTLSIQSRLLTCLPYPYNHGLSRIYRIRTITAFHVSHFQR